LSVATCSRSPHDPFERLHIARASRRRSACCVGMVSLAAKVQP